VDRIFRESRGLGSLRVGLYGSEPRIAEAATASIRSRYPWVEFVAAVHPPFGELTAEAEQAHIDELAAGSPQICLVMLGCPRQEDVIGRFHDQIPSAVWIGVGGTLDFYAGKRQRAPEWAQRAGLEWAVRLIQEPRRLWRRYILRDIPELIALVGQTAMRRGTRARQLPSD
ncbi:WecB/TagA/CpsF family glycosyltransferase, partial [Limnoraphis robusta]